jgi:hypothetical protein
MVSLSGFLLLSACAPTLWDPRSGWFSSGWAPVGLVSTAVYFLPIIIGVVRHKKRMVGIVLLNVLAGWTFIGWIIALIWAFQEDR